VTAEPIRSETISCSGQRHSEVKISAARSAGQCARTHVHHAIGRCPLVVISPFPRAFELVLKVLALLAYGLSCRTILESIQQPSRGRTCEGVHAIERLSP
jgi:hypothetical protein